MKTTITLLLFFLLINCSYAQVKKTSNLNTDVDAEFPGGIAGLFAFLRENIKYPDEAYKLPPEGDRVKVRFSVNQKGEIEHAKISKTIPECPSCSAEVLRVIALMPLWEPAIKDGMPVKAYFELPIVFKPNKETKDTTPETK